MERTELDDLKQRTSCIDVVGRYLPLRKASSTEYEGPCPRCGGTDRLHVKADGWFCRQCHAKWGDAIEFVTWATGATFTEAVESLGGTAMLQTQPHVTQTRKPAPKPQPADWPAFAARLVDSAQAALPYSPGADYLTSRGLAPATWQAYRLGYVDKAERVRAEYEVPAIVLPWIKGGRILGIRYRFLTHVGDKRLHAAGDSVFSGVLFGGHALWVDTGTDNRILAKRRLVLCEGEINAMSIAQVTADLRTDVLSIGSESQRLTDAQVTFFLRYGTRIVWADKPSVRDELAKQLQAHMSMASQATDADKCKTDANDCLRKGTLFDVMVRAFRAGPDAEALHWDLWDAENC